MKKKRDSSKDRIRRRGRGKNGRLEEWKNGRMEEWQNGFSTGCIAIVLREKARKKISQTDKEIKDNDNNNNCSEVK